MERVPNPFLYGATAVGHILRKDSVSRFGLSPVILDADRAIMCQWIEAGANVKFCRLPIVHNYSYPHNVINLRRDVVYRQTRKLVYRYCPIWFAVWYQFDKRFKRTKMWELLRRARRKFFPPKVQEIIWDGGFS